MAAALLSGGIVNAAEAQRRRVATWTVNRVTDPITGATRCTVAALDRTGHMRSTRTGGIYPVVEMNSEFGLLVGVSSGGQIRLPTGDILWRVDDRPFRTLRPQDNPAAQPTASTASGAAELARVYQVSAAYTATSTMASGERAREMLEEMLAGRTLIYRQAGSAGTFGLVDPGAAAVGQVTREGLVPYQLDGSFRDGLQACGIAVGTN